ncbi:hypothetical protein [Lysobacter sp. GCM10012299]|uniref:OB-fold protein n=1 Tax=Lysobacter sp. GCM10012299 TaxID=3317333 RepID=UPI0036112858
MNAQVTSAPNTAGKAAWICLAIAWVAFLAPLPLTSWIVGWPLNAVGFVLAIVAMSKLGARAGLWPLIASLIVSPVVYFIGLALFAGGVAATAASANAQLEQQRTEVMASAPVAAVSASDLFESYDANEVAAEALYKGKRLEVRGKVDGIYKGFTDSSYVKLEAGDNFHSVDLYGLANNVAAGLKKGQIVTAVCTGGGLIVTTVNLKDCVLK